MDKTKYYILGGVVLVVLVIILTTMSKKSEPVMEKSNVGSSTLEYHDNIYLVKTDTAKGSFLADFQGRALYTYDKDTAGVSNCDSTCLKTWPMYTSGATSQGIFPKDITLVKHADGSLQFAWKNMPLYYYAEDKNPGEIKGDGVGGIWHIAKP